MPTVSGDPDGIVFAINVNGRAASATGECTQFLSNGDLTYLHGLHARLSENGVVHDLGNLGGGGNTAFSINNRGQVLGHAGTANGTGHDYLWSRETGMNDLGTLPGDFTSVALGINDNGDMVGISLDAEFNPRAYLRPAHGAMVDLNTLIPANSPLFRFDAAQSICRERLSGLPWTAPVISMDSWQLRATPTQIQLLQHPKTTGQNSITRADSFWKEWAWTGSAPRPSSGTDRMHEPRIEPVFQLRKGSLRGLAITRRPPSAEVSPI